MDPTDFIFKPYKWLKEAVVLNKNGERVPIEWLETNADIIALLFTANEIDKDRVIEKFYEIYENVKFVNVPIEVIYIPMDETEEEAKKCYESQANWFTLNFSDPLISVLKYMYNITCIPHLLVISVDGTIISSHGILDLEEYGKNAVITWLSKTASTSKFRRLSKELTMYGDKWRYMNVDPKKSAKPDYQRKFSAVLEESNAKLTKSGNISE